MELDGAPLPPTSSVIQGWLTIRPAARLAKPRW